MKLEHTLHSNLKKKKKIQKCKMAKRIKHRPNTIKLPEENIGKTVSDIHHSNVFLGQSPKAKFYPSQKV